MKTFASCRLGAESPFGLALPSGSPTASQLYAPRGVFLNDAWLVVADTGNHRVLLWRGLPTHDGQPADIVLGQADFFTEGANACGRGPANGLHLPTGVAIHEGRLIVADAWNHRLLVWDTVPTASDTPPDYALGQPNMEAVAPNQGADVRADTFYWPFSFGFAGDRFYVADTGNRRVLGWHGLPAPGELPDVILGQPDAPSRNENRDGPVSARSFRWPHAIAGSCAAPGKQAALYVADAGNHRVLGWAGLPDQDRDADLVLGQQSFTTAIEFPYAQGGQGAAALRFPYCLALQDKTLAVADTANNRVLFWHDLPPAGSGLAADAVTGQVDFAHTGENHWKAVAPDTLCWPYGIAMHRQTLAVADSGNNRVTLWQMEESQPPTANIQTHAYATGDF
jgi:hypothetical protein